MAENLPPNAGDTGSSPDLERSHMPWGNWARAPQLLKPVHLEPVLQNEREATTVRSPRTTTKSSPLSPQLEKDCMQQQRPNAAKNK